jgi:hypothetical protein
MGVKALSIIFKANRMTSRQMHQLMFELYHGIPGTLCGQTTMMMNPSGVYEVMFERRYRVIIGSSEDAQQFVLNKDIFQVDSDYFLDGLINKHVLESRSQTVSNGLLVTGRTMFFIATNASAGQVPFLVFIYHFW